MSTTPAADTTRAAIASTYTRFAVREARDVSASYERLATAVSGDPDLLSLLATVPEPKRQPALLLAVVRLLGGPVDDPAAFHDFVTTHWTTIAANLRTRATQTNEPGRCALLLPVLAALPQPLALLEVGASAGLGLYPDRYTYRYGDHEIGTGGPVLDCALSGPYPGTGFRWRRRTCCLWPGCPRRQTRPSTMCSRSTACRWPGPGVTDRRWPGSADPAIIHRP